MRIVNVIKLLVWSIFSIAGMGVCSISFGVIGLAVSLIISLLLLIAIK